ncbi:response regulator [Corynebacterium glaucum]|uniref:response regulator n=1 Tax=Corynebacterium glaucum TaxID=187491 RepID=UPI002659886C|nr:response regulator transcription factor [Corynebacterium glaucum]
MSRATIVLADDNAELRNVYRRAFALRSDLELVGEAGDGVEALHQIAAHRPTVALIDMRMPKMDGLGVLERMDMSTTSAIVFTAFNEARFVEPALRLGASGFLLKNCSPQEVLDGIDAVLEGNACLAPEVARRVLDVIQSKPRLDASGPRARPSIRDVSFSAREREVIELVGKGLSTGDIAAQLVVQPETVRTYLKRIYAKTGISNRTTLAVAAIEAGVYTPRV